MWKFGKPFLDASRFKFSFLKSSFLFCLVIFAAGLIVRIFFLQQISALPYFDNPVIDPKQYDDFAHQLVEGSMMGFKPFYQAPLYAYFLAAIYKVFGDDRVWAHIVQIILGASNIFWIYFLAKKVFSHRVALLSSFIAAFYGTFIFYEGDFYRENLLISLYLWMVLSLYWAVRLPSAPASRPAGWDSAEGTANGLPEESSDRSGAGLSPPTWMSLTCAAGKWILAGLFFSLSVVTRENSLIFLPLILYVIWCLMEGGIAKKIVSTVCVVLPLSFFLYQMARFNYEAEGSWTIVSSQGGLNFYLGNNPEMDKTTTLQPGIEWEKIASLPLREEGILKSREASSWFYRKAFGFILRHPFQWARIMLKKFYLFWTGYEMMPNEDINLYREASPVLKVLIWRLKGFNFPFGVICPLAILGMMFVVKYKRKVGMPILWLILFYMISVVLYHVRARYRLPVIPFFIILSSCGLIHLISLMKEKKKKPFFRAASWLVVFAVFVNFPLYDFSYAEKFPSSYNIAKIYHEQKKHKEALAKYGRALKDGINLAESHHDLALLYLDLGRRDLAVKELKESIALAPDFDKMRITLGKTYREMKSGNYAKREYEKAIRINRYNPEAFLEMAEISEKKNPVQAKEHYYRVLELGNLLVNVDREFLKRARNGLWRLGDWEVDDSSVMPEKVKRVALKARLKESRKIIKRADLSTKEGRIKASDAWNNIGVAYLRLGDLKKAGKCFLNSLNISYSQTPAHINLGSTYRKLGLLDKAAKHYEEALKVLPENYIALNNLGAIYRDKKEYKKALEYYRKALSFDPGNPTIERNIKVVNKLSNGAGH